MQHLGRDARSPVALLKATWQAFNDDKAQRLAAAVAYAAIFSIAPLFIVLVAIVGSVLDARGTHGGHTAALDSLLANIRANAGQSAATTVRSLIESSFNKPKTGIIAQILGWIFFVLGASGLFAALQDALNAIWHVEATRGGWRQMVRDRLASFGMILGVGLLLLLTFVANAALTFASAHTRDIPIVGNPIVAAVASALVTLAIATAIFALLFKVLPDVDIAWRDVWIGAAATAVLFAIGESLIGIYIAKAGVASAYGAAGSLLVALVWIYYSALILLLGAEFTKVRARHAALSVDAIIRHTSERKRGIDPRAAANDGNVAMHEASFEPFDDEEPDAQLTPAR